MTNRELLFFQGEDIKNVPAKPGIYAWYYRPLGHNVVASGQLKETLSRLVPYPERVKTEIKNRYNVRYAGEADLLPYYGSTNRSCIEKIEEAINISQNFVGEFVKNFMVPAFTSPLYIGIASNLYGRVYKQHYKQLTDLWMTNSYVSKFMTSSQPETIQEMLTSLGLAHSFAIEARFRGFSPRDLVVYISITDKIISADNSSIDKKNYAAVEDLLQLLSDPICGRM